MRQGTESSRRRVLSDQVEHDYVAELDWITACGADID